MKRLVQPGAVRYPRCQVMVDGAAMPGAEHLEVTSNAHYQADSFRVRLALNADGGQTLDWWGAAARTGALFDLRFDLNGDVRSMIIGEASEIRIRPETGSVDVTGRDLTARFIDNRTQEAFQNRTASEIAITLAQRRGLTPVVTPTTALASRYYGADHDRVTNDQFSHVSSEWDLLVWLAQNEGFDVFVSGTELHFQPATDPLAAEPYAVRWDQDRRRSDVSNIDLGRSLTLAKDVVVVVRSWRSAEGRGFSRSSPAGASRAKVNAGTAQRYVFTRPNLTEDQAQKLADSLRADITKHERTLSFDCPGELDLGARDVIQLSGCGGWDQTYFVDTISRRVSMEGGFEQTVTAKNKNVESQASVS